MTKDEIILLGAARLSLETRASHEWAMKFMNHVAQEFERLHSKPLAGEELRGTPMSDWGINGPNARYAAAQSDAHIGDFKPYHKKRKR